VPTYEGRLELTWTNKPLRLLAHEDGSYEWVPPSDYRVAEVRLLHDAGTVGEVHGTRDRAKDNLLIRGDALNALTSLIELPEFEREYVGKVKLAYLDPPFNTQQSFLHYDDALEHSVWLTMMRDRLLSIKTLLSPSGSVWVHLDDSEMGYCRVMMDEIFGRENFVAAVIWQKAHSARNDATQFSVDHDYILVYSRNPDWRPYLLARDETMNARYSNPDNDPRGPWQAGDLTANGFRKNGNYAIATPSGRVIPGPPPGGCWRYPEERFKELLVDNRIHWRKGGAGEPRIKRFLSEVKQGRVPRTFWPNDEVGHSQDAKQEIKDLVPVVQPFATPKPERLLERVLKIATEPGDVVLDCFLGSGTTAAVAHKTGRQWVGVEQSAVTLETFTVPRLTKVVAGQDRGGATEMAGWNGGGGFRILDVAPSMFEAIEGQVFLREWATNGKLAEVTAAQLHYDYEYAPPFAGRRGRSRLSVIDGLVNEDVAQLVVSALPEDERVVICGTAIDPEAKAALRKLRPGSTVRKIPHSILQEYRQAARWTQPSLFAGGDNGARMPEGEAAPA